MTGVVQGVGFRPFVHRLALRYGLRGWVRNGSEGVRIRAEGPLNAIAGFTGALHVETPPLCRIDNVAWQPVWPSGVDSFEIRPSVEEPGHRLPTPPDVATCAACAAEMRDPGNRRYRYPFITCTDCGPRVTVIEAMPYDRERTSMRSFTQCPACQAEYGTPGDRRYHSETNSCGACGPVLWFVRGGLGLEGGRGGTSPGAAGRDVEAPIRRCGIHPALDYEAPIREAARLLREGGILALRGLGGFHLAADATDPAAVTRLRLRKHREVKPLAVMVRDVEEAARLGEVGPVAEGLLCAPERPIVLLRRHADSPLASGVAPGLGEVGVMLTYTPLHDLLLEAAGTPLVMTSGNRSDEPIATGNEEARRCLAGIADGFLLHDREIVARYDDSVIRPIGGAPTFLRRARGYAPLPLGLPVPTPRPLVAVGAEVKNTFALAHGGTAWVSPHIGDLESVETSAHFTAALGRFAEFCRIEPEVVVRDLHPDYLSSGLADEMRLERVIGVQHHHAHIAAVLAEHDMTQPVIGLAFDGAGYGEDGHIWGAEALIADLTTSQRVGQLRYAPLPGGDTGARNPWRAAVGYAALDPGSIDLSPSAPFLRGIREAEVRLVQQQIAHRLNAPLASSMGRLFDAAAALLGVRSQSRYEGQAAMELEALASGAPAVGHREELPFPLVDAGDLLVLDPVPLLAALDQRRASGEDVAVLAARFHAAVAAGAVSLALRLRERFGLCTVALGGGSFQNALLTPALIARLGAAGFRVLFPRRLSPNDGAISYGQAAVAAARLTREA